MNHHPTCVIVTGRPGSGKTTLSQKLGQQLWLPVISRDELKQGYVNTFGVRHDELPDDTNATVSNFFFDVVSQYLTAKISLVIEAAFQHAMWQTRLPEILKLSAPCFIICSLDAETAAQRHLQRGLQDSQREFYHGDERVAIYRATGEIAPPSQYVAPHFDVPTLHVATDDDYAPHINEIVAWIRAQKRQ